MSVILDETLGAIEGSGHAPEDIIFIGSTETGHSCTWDEFKRLAEEGDANYYSGYGGQTLASDLQIAFSDGSIMRRTEYDGAEGWESVKPFEIPYELKPIATICNGESWATLEEMNRPGGKYDASK